MSFEEDDRVVYHDKHSEHDGETGTVTQVVENMFGDATYTVSFEDGQESGVPETSLETDEQIEDDGSVVESDEDEDLSADPSDATKDD